MKSSLTLTLLLILLAFGCSGGGGSGGGADSGGIGGSGISRGIVTRLDSATLAGTRFDIDSAQFEFDDVAGGVPSDVVLGMKLTVEGDRNAAGTEGTADTVVFDDDIEGPIDEILVLTPDRKELAILGQTVVIDRFETVFDGGPTFDFDTIDVADVVEVSGLRDDAGIDATRVLFKSTNPMPPVELKGEISGLLGNEFQLGSVTVLFDTNTTDLSEAPNGLSEELFVEVGGVLDALGRVDATSGRIEEEEGALEGDLDDVQIEGLVTDFVNPSIFSVGGQPVEVPAFGVLFVPSDPSFIQDGARIEVDGRLSNDVLIAEEVRQREAEVRITAQIASDADVDATAGTIRLLGTIDVEVGPGTRFDDFGDLSDLGVGDYIEVRGVSVSGAVEASRVKLEGSGDEVKLQGRVSGFDPGSDPRSFTILDVQMPTSRDTDIDDIPGVTDEDEFYSYLATFGTPQALLEVEDDKVDEEEDVRIAAEIADNADIDVGGEMLTLLGVVDIDFDDLDDEDFEDCLSIPGLDGIEDLAAGDFLVIDGIRENGGAFVASQVRCEDTPGSVQLRGRVESFDGTAEEFTVLGVVVPTGAGTSFTDVPDVSTPMEFYDLLAARDTDGIDVTMAVTDTADGDATTLDEADDVDQVFLFANKVEPVDEVDEVRVAAEIADDADVDQTANQLTLLGQVVISFDEVLLFVACTDIPAFNGLEDLRGPIAPSTPGDFVIVDGTRLAGGIVRATRVECVDAADTRDVELLGRVEAFDPPPGATNFTALGVVVDTDTGTSFESFPTGTAESDFYDFLAANPTAVVDVTDDDDADDTAIDIADEVELEDDGD